MEGNWETVHILYAKADPRTGAVTCQTGDVKSGTVFDPDATVVQQWGLLALCAPPIKGVSAPEGVTLNGTSVNVVIAGRSVRSAYLAGLIKQGETALFADGSQAVALFKLDGSINLLTTHDNTKDGRNVNMRLGPDGWRFEWPWSRLKVEKDGLHFDHKSGALFSVTALELTGPFAPLSQFKSFFTVRADMSAIESAFLAVGPADSIKSPVARADALVTVLNTVSSALSSLSSILTALQTEVTAVAAAAQPAVTAATVGTTIGAAAIVPVTALVASTVATLGTAVAAIAAAGLGTTPVPGAIGAKSLAAS